MSIAASHNTNGRHRIKNPEHPRSPANSATGNDSDADARTHPFTSLCDALSWSGDEGRYGRSLRWPGLREIGLAADPTELSAVQQQVLFRISGTERIVRPQKCRTARGVLTRTDTEHRSCRGLRAEFRREAPPKKSALFETASISGICFAAGGRGEKELFGHGSVLGAGWLTRRNYTRCGVFWLVLYCVAMPRNF